MTIAVALLGVYIITTPFPHYLGLWWDQLFDGSGGVRYSGQLADDAKQNADPNTPDGLRLVIPSIRLSKEIVTLYTRTPICTAKDSPIIMGHSLPPDDVQTEEVSAQ